MRQRQSSKNYSKLKYYFWVLLIGLSGFFSLFLLDKYFTIQQFEIISTKEKIAVSGLENLEQKNILLSSDQEIIQIISANNPQLKNIQVEKRLPNQLVINVEFDQSIAALKVNQGYFLLNLTGKILAKDKESSGGLPTINYYQQLNYNAYSAGNKIDLKDIVVSLHFVKKVKGTGLEVLSIDIAGVDMIRLNLQNKKVLVFSVDKDLSLQDYQFEKLIRQFKIEGKEFESLDFRFDKPIVKLR